MILGLCGLSPRQTTKEFQVEYIENLHNFWGKICPITHIFAFINMVSKDLASEAIEAHKPEVEKPKNDHSS